MEDVQAVDVVGHELSSEGGTKHVRYLVRVHFCALSVGVAGEGHTSSSYVVRRRYQHFCTLHQRLRDELRAVDGGPAAHPAPALPSLPSASLVRSFAAAYIATKSAQLARYLRAVAALCGGSSGSSGAAGSRSATARSRWAALTRLHLEAFLREDEGEAEGAAGGKGERYLRAVVEAGARRAPPTANALAARWVLN
eukprot:g7778.t1